MNTTEELRKQVESTLAGRIPAALSFRPPVTPELYSCGLSEVDSVLGGGLPLGAITELTGAYSSGRTTLVLSALAEVTRQGEVCAYVDTSDALNPLSASAQGVVLRRLLWVRAGEVRNEAAEATGYPFPATTPAPATADKKIHGTGWCHPRNETFGLSHAVGELFQTVPKEKVGFTPRCSEVVRRERVQPVSFTPVAFAPKVQDWPQRSAPMHRESPWTRLDQALRATDLLLSTGGFRTIVLDMADLPSEQARRVPLATWYRFRLQAEKSRTLLLLMTRVPCANSCAAVSLHCQQREISWQQASLNSPRLLGELHYRVSVERRRAADPLRRKPAAFAEAHWSSTTLGSR